MAAPSPHSDGTSRSIAHAGRRKAGGSAAVGTVLRSKRKAPRSAGNPWSSPAGLRPRTARDRGAHRSAAAALGYPRFGVTAAPPECRSPLRGRHLRRAATLVFHRITPFVGRISQVAGPNPPSRRTAQVHQQPPRHARNLYISDRSISRAGCQLARAYARGWRGAELGRGGDERAADRDARPDQRRHGRGHCGSGHTGVSASSVSTSMARAIVYRRRRSRRRPQNRCVLNPTAR